MDTPLSHSTVDRSKDLVRTFLLRGEHVCVARVSVPSDSALWDRPCSTSSWAGLAFPRRAIGFLGADEPRVVNLNHLVLFRERAEYTRSRVDRGGETTDVLWFSPAAVGRALGVEQTPRLPGVDRARMSTALCAAALRRAQSGLFEYVRTSGNPSVALVEEAGAAILRRAFADARLGARVGAPGDARGATHERHVAAIGRAIQYISSHFHRPLPLDEIARAAGFTRAHFCRIFRRVVGQSVHEYLRTLRLQVALQRLRTHGGRTVDLALELGFSSRAHLSSAFARWYGSPLSRAFVQGEAACEEELRRRIAALSEGAA